MRLDRFLAETTPLSRSQAKKALAQGEVTLDGDIVKQAAWQVAENARVAWRGERLTLVGLRYVMLHKPAGVECSARRGLYVRAVDLIDLPKAERLHPVGRLDVDTTGLLLLSDDGQWAHRVTAPRRRCPKTYRACLARPLAGEALANALAAFREGILLDGETTPTRPAELISLGPQDVRLTIHEGRYHQVRRMFAAIGNHVAALHRETVGPLTLGDLPEGGWRELTEAEVATF
ncbi:MAG: pseudouridine synthase [Pseudomonadota bacterium]